MPSAWVTRSRSPLVPSTTVCAPRSFRSFAKSTRRKKQRDQREPSGGQRGDAGGRCEVIGHVEGYPHRGRPKTVGSRHGVQPADRYSVNTTWYVAVLLSLVPSPGTGAISTVTSLTPCVSGFSRDRDADRLLLAGSDPRDRLLDVDVLAVRDRDRDGHVGLLRLALVLDLDVEGHLIGHGDPVHAAVGQLRPGRLRGHALEARAVEARRRGLVRSARDTAEPRLDGVGIEPAEVRQEPVGREPLVDAPLVVGVASARGSRAAR